MPLDLPAYPAAPRKNLPRPALGNPSIERAMNGLDKAYPRDTAGIDAVPDWGPGMFTNAAGHVNTDDPSKIYINGLTSALSKQPDVDYVLAHELEHTRQLKDPAQRTAMATSFAQPYVDRRHEQNATEVGNAYVDKVRKPTSHDARFTADIEQGVMSDLSQSPGVRELINLLNRR